MAFLPGQIGGGSGQLTPEQVERLRLASQESASRGADTSPVAHWAAALARGIDAYGGYRGQMRANEQEAAGDALAEERVRSDPRLASALGLGGPEVGPVPSALTQSGPVAPQPIPQGMPSVPGAPMVSGSDPNAAYIRTGLVNRGLPEHVADAFMMNFMDESGLNPGINEANPVVPGSRGGFGLYQLTGPRRREYEAYAASRGVPVDDVDAQLDFMMQELSGSESAAAKKILSAPDTGSAAAAIVNSFLRPSEEHRARRAAKYTAAGGSPADFAAAPTQGNSAAVSALMGALSDPWVAKRYGPQMEALMQQGMGRDDAAYEAQLKQKDPMYQAQLQQQQLQNEALMNPEVDPWAGTQVINNQVVGMGPQGPQVLGDFNTTDPTSQRQNYADLLQMGVDPERALEMAYSGGQTINIGGEDKFADEFAKGDASSLVAVSDAGSMAQRNLGRIDQLENLLSNSPTGLTGRAKQYAGEWGIDTEGLSDIQAAQALINSLVPEQRPAGSGPMSDADLELFKQSLPRIINTPEGNQLIIDTMRGIAQYDAEGAMIVQQLRRGELDRATAFDMLQNRVNPLANFSSVGSATGGNDAIPSGVDPSDWEYMTPEERALFQ